MAVDIDDEDDLPEILTDETAVTDALIGEPANGRPLLDRLRDRLMGGGYSIGGRVGTQTGRWPIDIAGQLARGSEAIVSREMAERFQTLVTPSANLGAAQSFNFADIELRVMSRLAEAGIDPSSGRDYTTLQVQHIDGRTEYVRVATDHPRAAPEQSRRIISGVYRRGNELFRDYLDGGCDIVPVPAHSWSGPMQGMAGWEAPIMRLCDIEGTPPDGFLELIRSHFGEDDYGIEVICGNPARTETSWQFGGGEHLHATMLSFKWRQIVSGRARLIVSHDTQHSQRLELTDDIPPDALRWDFYATPTEHRRLLFSIIRDGTVHGFPGVVERRKTANLRRVLGD